MRNKRSLILIAAVLAVLSFCILTASAQTTDPGSPDNAQLLELLQSIMEKLQQEGNTQTEAQPKETDPLQITPEIPAAATVRPISIHMNKKLFVGEMPDYYFIRPVISDKEEDVDDTQPTKTPEEIHNCPPGYTYECYTNIMTGQYICECGVG